jgi:HK97 family phage major capsid protein
MSGDDQTGQDAANSGPTLTHPQCINRLQEIRDQMSQIAQLERPSAEDDRYFAELTAEFDQVDAHRAKLERDAQLARVKGVADGLSASRHLRAAPGAYGTTSGGDGYDRDAILEPDSIQAKRFRNPWDLSEVRTFGRSQEELTSEYRARALSAVEQMQSANDHVRSAATDVIEQWDDEGGHLSQLTLALSEPTYLRAWSKLARDPHAAELDNDERKAVSRVKMLSRAMSLTDAAGGYLVPFQLDPTIIITANGSVNQIRQVARQVIATSDVWNGVSAGAVSWSYDAEAAEVSDDSPTLAQPTVPVYKAQGFVPISTEAFQDAANVTAEVGRLLAFGKDVLEANAFAVGTGTGMPTGLITALTGTTSEVAAATDDTFALADVYALHGALPARYRNMPSTAWMANTLIYNRIRQFDTSGGAALWAQLGEGQPQALLGRRALESEDMDGTITATAANYVLVFGDFENYIIADRIGTTVEFVPHLFGANRRPTNQRGWLAYVRHGADSVNDAGFRMLNV